MNCLEFRRAALADPRRIDAEAAQHADQCRGCKDYLVSAIEAEARLAAALRVPVPEGLRARVLDRTAAARRPRWLALAASFAAAALVVLALAWPRNDAMALAGIQFVVFEEAQVIADAKPADPRVLAAVARSMGVALPEQLGDIHYVGTCPFGGSIAHHVLVKSPLGKVTLLLIPEGNPGSRRVAAAHGLEATIVPVQSGSVAIIGGSTHSVVRTETLLNPT